VTANKVLDILLHFGTSYLSESAFSTLKIMKSNSRSGQIDTENELCVCLSVIRPRIEEQFEIHQY
jgi:hypothetical protein